MARCARHSSFVIRHYGVPAAQKGAAVGLFGAFHHRPSGANVDSPRMGRMLIRPYYPSRNFPAAQRAQRAVVPKNKETACRPPFAGGAPYFA